MNTYRGIIEIACGQSICPIDTARANVVASCARCSEGAARIVDCDGVLLIELPGTEGTTATAADNQNQHTNTQEV